MWNSLASARLYKQDHAVRYDVVMAILLFLSLFILMSSNAVWCACSACCGAITGNEDPSLDSRLGVVNSRKLAYRHCSKHNIYHDVCKLGREAGKLQLEHFWPIGSVHPGEQILVVKRIRLFFLRTKYNYDN